MNEILFIFQVLIIIVFALISARLGKSALVAWVAMQSFIANLFVLKQIHLFGFEVTASDSYAIGGLLGLNCLQEIYGRKEAEKTTWICFSLLGFFVLVSQLHLIYIPSPHDQSQDAFITLFSPSPRLLLSSMIVFFAVQKLDIALFGFIKKLLPELGFAYRAAFCLVISQFLDTFLFSLIGLYGIVSSLSDIIFVSFTIKLIVIFLFTPFIRWAKI